jgi:hypothetical protein
MRCIAGVDGQIVLVILKAQLSAFPKLPKLAVADMLLLNRGDQVGIGSLLNLDLNLRVGLRR